MNQDDPDIDPQLAKLLRSTKRWQLDNPAYGDARAEHVLAGVRRATRLRPPARVIAVAAVGSLALAALALLSTWGGSPPSAADSAAPSIVAPLPATSATSATSATPAGADAVSIPSVRVDDLPAVGSAAPAPAPGKATGLSLTEELSMVERARHALAARDPREALDALRAHRRKYPHGELAQERERLAIDALLLQGDMTAARARAREFHRDYPKGLLAPSVDSLLGDP